MTHLEITQYQLDNAIWLSSTVAKGQRKARSLPSVARSGFLVRTGTVLIGLGAILTLLGGAL